MKKKSTTLLIVLCCMMALFFSCDSGESGGSEADDSGGSGGSEGEAIKLPVVGSVIPDGAYFARWNGAEYEGVLSGGASFPAVFQEYDLFLYGDYFYMYGHDYDEGNEVPDGWSACVAHYGHLDNALFPGFEFKDVSTFDNAGLICESINGKKIKSLNNIFTDCSALKNFVDGFAVPAGVTDLYEMFEECNSLETLPADFRIPAGVTDMVYMFFECSSLETLPAGFTVPDSVTEMYGMFDGCTSLVSLPADFTVPDSVTGMFGMFYECTSLVSLPAGFTIPDGVTEMINMFYECTSLVSLPAGFTVPDSVTGMFGTFDGCTSLSGTITINANPTDYEDCFCNAGKDTTDGIVLKGSSTKLDALAATKGTYGKVTVAP